MRCYFVDPDIAYIYSDLGTYEAVGHDMLKGFGQSEEEAVVDFYRRRILRIMRKLLGADRRPRCNTDRELRR